MGDTRLSAFAAASALVGADIVPVLQGGLNKKATIDQINASLIINEKLPADGPSTYPAGLSMFDTLSSGWPELCRYRGTVNVGDGL